MYRQKRVACPYPGCGRKFAGPMNVRIHFSAAHPLLSRREASELLATLPYTSTGKERREGEDIEHAIAEYDRSIADGSFVEKKVRLDG